MSRPALIEYRGGSLAVGDLVTVAVDCDDDYARKGQTGHVVGVTRARRCTCVYEVRLDGVAGTKHFLRGALTAGARS